MAPSARLKALDTGIRELLKPELERRGFSYVTSCRQFSRRSGSCIQLIELQPGVRSAEGTFAVNLAVYHPVYRDRAAGDGHPRAHDCLFDVRQRLGALRETWRTRLFGRVLGHLDGWLARRLTTTGDRWWRFSTDEATIRRSLRDVLRLLDAQGLDWLDAHSHEQLLQRAHASMVGRQQRRSPYR